MNTLTAPRRHLRTRGSRLRIRLAASTALTGLIRVSAALFAGSLGLGLAPAALALPTGGVVAGGVATVTPGPGTLTIHQGSQTAILNWQTFGIGQGEAVSFVQPNSSSVTLNRVLGADPSAILGSLAANGKVFLVNPNGILFGKDAQVNVGGLVASTRGITDADVMAGRLRFTGSSSGQVMNQGTLNADGGYVALLGANVSNEGVISARLGAVALVAGDAITLDVAGDGLLSVAIDAGAVDALVQNGGLIRAEGGQVLMTARTAGQLLRTVVNNTGVIEARSVQERNGVITLLGDMQSGRVEVAGVVDASGLGAGQSGGRVVVSGHEVALLGDARLDASGAVGGGAVLVGGGYQGKVAAIPNATTVSMDRGVAIAADAADAGSGGQVVLWSEGATRVDGTITARGGARSGDGGSVETSGHRVHLGDHAFVDTRAPAGKTGQWLLDPVNYTIAITGGDETPGAVTISLASSNRTITATNDITVADALTWTTAQTLELNAGHDVLINAAITASTAGSRLRLVAGNDVDVNAAITASALGSVVEINAGQDVTIDALAGVITASGGGAAVLRADNDGTGGPTGGTVKVNGLITADSTTIYYSPENGYAMPNAYTGFVSHMWVFVDAADKVYDGGTAATATFRGDPTAGGLLVGLTPGAIAFADKNVGPAKPVDFSGYGINGANAARFALFEAAGQTTAAITAAPLTITADSASKVYGQTATLSGTTFTSTGLLAGETIGSVTKASAGAVATAAVGGSPYAITPSAATGGTFTLANYAPTYVDGLLTVTPAALTITANNATKVYGQTATFAGTAFTSTGLVNGETIGTVSEVSTGSVATAGVGGSPYGITPSAAVGGSFTLANYAPTYVSGALTVTPAALVITANNATKVYGQTATFAGTAFTSTGLVNGDTVGTVTEVSTGATAAASVGGGPYAINASSAVGGSFTPANYATTYAPGVLTLTPATLVITADSTSKTFGDTLTFTGSEFSSTGLVNGDTVGSVTETSAGAVGGATIAGGPYSIVASNAVGGNYSPTNYSTSYVDGALTVVAAAPVVPPVVPPVVTPPVVTPPVVTPPVVPPPAPPVVAPPVVTPPIETPTPGPLTPPAPPPLAPPTVTPRDPIPPPAAFVGLTASEAATLSTAIASQADNSTEDRRQIVHADFTGAVQFTMVGSGVAMPSDRLRAEVVPQKTSRVAETGDDVVLAAPILRETQIAEPVTAVRTPKQDRH